MALMSYLFIPVALLILCAGTVNSQGSTGSGSPPPTIITNPKTVNTRIGDSAILYCEIKDLSLTDTISWFFLDHAVKISENLNILLDSNRYSIEQPSVSGSPNASLHFSLVIIDLQATDGGAYQCRVDSEGRQPISVTHTLIVADAKRPLPANASITNHTDCCLKEGVSPACLPICDRSTLDASTFDPSSCDADVLKLVKCGTAGRNHVNCCRRSQVPVHCLELCSASNIQLGPHLDNCIVFDPQINACYNEGQVTLPSPPTEVTAVGIPEGFEVKWMPPRENEKLVTGYRVSYRPFGNTSEAFKTTEIIGADSLSKGVYVKGNDRYQVYVIAISRHGSSQPSSLVEIHPGISTVKSPHDISIYECCKGQNVQPMCRESLCKSWGYRSLNPANIEFCESDLDGVFHCISGGRNHSQCCLRNDIPNECLGLCSGQIVSFSWDLVPCLLRLQMIESCLEEGLGTLPGAPLNVRVDSVEVTQATLEWDEAYVGLAKVDSYLVRYRPRTANNIEPYIELSTTGLFAVLGPLQEDTVYEAMVLSLHNDSGSSMSSLPSPTLVFQTYSEELYSSGNPMDETGSPAEPHDMRACCEKKMVGAECLWLCSYDLDFDGIIHTNYTALQECRRYISPMLTCAADNRNHVPCCQTSLVPQSCQYMCSLSHTAVVDLPKPECVIRSGQVLRCFKAGVGILPRAPENVTVSNTTTRSMILRWDPPSAGPRASGYKVQYTMIQSTEEIFKIPFSDWSMAHTTRTVYILQNLKPNTMYAVGVLSVNGNGSSLASDFITQTTAFEPGSYPSINFTTPAPGTTEHPIFVQPTEPPANRSDCCTKKGVSSECLSSCEQGEVLNGTCTLDLFSIVACSADGGDHTDCCRLRRVPIQCRPLCSGELQYFRQPPSIFCASYVDSITFCLQRNTVSLPSQPINFGVSSVGSRSMRLKWDPPLTNGVGCTYNVYYSIIERNYKTPPSVIFSVDSPLLLSPLKAGKYYEIYVVAVNKFGRSQASAKHVIRTYWEAPLRASVAQSPAGVPDLGSSVTLVCYNEGSPPPMLFEWLFHKHLKKISVQYPLVNLTKDMEGPYTCRIKNRIATANDTLFLAIRYKPELFHPQGDSRFPDVGNIGKLKCMFRGQPSRVIWLKDNKPVDSMRIMRQYITVDSSNGTTIAELDVGFVSEQDYGHYTCQGINKYGKTTGQAQLTNPATTSHIAPPVKPEVTNYPNVTACCMSEGVHDECMNVCSYNIDLSRLQQSTSRSKCLSAAEIFIKCAADGRDHTQCCVKNRVWEKCQPMCRGETLDFFADETNYDCLRYTSKVVDCLQEGQKIIPSPPRFVNAFAVAPGKISVTWESPLRNSDKAVFHRVFYHRIGPSWPLEYISLENTYRNYTLDLWQEGRYTIWLRAGNLYGMSMNSTVVTIIVDGLVPLAPYDVLGQAISSNVISLHWLVPQNSPSIDHFVVFYRPKDGSKELEGVTAGSATGYFLTDLDYDTEYEIYIAGNNTHGMGKKSEVLHIRTGAKGSTKEPQAGGSNAVGLGIGLTVVILILIVAVILIALYYFRIRRNVSKPPGAVSFENPSYYEQPNPVHISGLRNESANSTDTTMQPVAMTDTSAKDVQFGYATLDEDHSAVNPSHDHANLEVKRSNGIDTREIKFAMDDGKSEA